MATNNRPRVAILLNDLYSSGGIQRVAVNLVRELGRRFDTRLLSVEPLDRPVFYDPALHFDSLNIRRVGSGRLRYVAEFASIGVKLRRYIAEQRIDVVLAIWYDWSTVCALALPRSVIKIGCEHIAFIEAPRFWRLMRRLSYRRLDAVVGLTEADLPALAAISRTACVIPNAVQPLAPKERAREKILLTVGHLIYRKGVDRLLWALQKPLHAHPEWRFVVLGGGEKGHADWGYLDYLATLVKLLHLEEQVIFHPATKAIDEWYRRASVYVMGSRQEGLPMVLIEAKSFGLPVVSFDCPTGPRQIIRHEVDGFLINDDDYAFGAAVDSLMQDEALRQRMGEAAVEDVRSRFSWDAVTQQWIDLIEGLVGERGGRPTQR